MRVSFVGLIVLALSCAASGAEQFPTTVPARTGDERHVRACYRKQSERTVIRGMIKVLEVDDAGNETRGMLTVEQCWREVDGARQELLPAGKKLIITRAAGKNEYFHEHNRPLEKETLQWVRLVCGLRGGKDDLAFWRMNDAGEWQVDEPALRKIIATAEFDMNSVQSQAHAANGEIKARLRIPKMIGKPNVSFGDGSFEVECRWRVRDGTLERFRHTHWVLRDRGTADEVTREVEIIGIEASSLREADAVFAEWTHAR